MNHGGDWRERVSDCDWERAQDERLDRLVAGCEGVLDRRGRLRGAALAAARARDLATARRLLTGLDLEVLLHPATPVVEALSSPLDRAAHAYLDFLEGRHDEAEAQLTAAVVEHGHAAVVHGVLLRHGTQLHLCANIVRVRADRGDAAGATALADAALAADGDPTAWPFADGPLDPWAPLPAEWRPVFRRQIVEARQRAAAVTT